MDLGIAGKRALVMGGSANLGLAIAEALAAEGVDLVLFARDRGKLAAAETRLRERFPVAVESVSGDMTAEADIAALAAQLRAGGGLDILILNTARPPSPMRELLAEDEPQRWEDGYRQQLSGALITLRLVTPLLLEKDWGRVIGITSATVKQPMPKHAISTVFRAGVQAALKHLAYEIAAKGVTVNSVAPATILTDSLRNNYNLDARAAAIPMKRLGTMEELASAVLYFASRQAGFITGQTMQVDGGMTLSLT